MLRIAVCDDDPDCLEHTKKLIQRWSDEKSTPVFIQCFLNGDALIDENLRKRFDIVFLDVVMPLLNGMGTARELREHDKAVSIVFLTSSPEFAVESYSVKAHDYILKPKMAERLSATLDELSVALYREPKSLLLKSICGYRKIDFRDIAFVEAQNKRILFHLRSGESVQITQPLNSFENQLVLQDGFFKCHRSYIVYMPNVNSFNTNEITMTCGTHIPIARGLGKAFHDAYFAFMFHE